MFIWSRLTEPRPSASVVDIAPSPHPIDGTWTGRFALVPGTERRTWLELSNSSWGEARIVGEFVDLDPGQQRQPGFGAANRGFFVSVPPPQKPQRLLGVPYARFQAKAAHVGGNPCRVDLRGRKNMYVDRIADSELDLSRPLKRGSVVFCNGGTLPPGTEFVVTRVTWQATTRAKSRSRVRVVVAGETLLDVAAEEEPIKGSWTGELRISASEESRTYLQVNYYSHADVTLTGYFVTR